MIPAWLAVLAVGYRSRQRNAQATAARATPE
jgi:hypothetical protein